MFQLKRKPHLVRLSVRRYCHCMLAYVGVWASGAATHDAEDDEGKDNENDASPKEAINSSPGILQIVILATAKHT